MDARIKAILADVGDGGWSSNGMWSPKILSELRTIAQHPEAQTVWRALDSRADLAATRHEDQLRVLKFGEYPGESPAFARALTETTFAKEACLLADHASAYMHDTQFLDEATKAERMALLHRVEKSIRDLKTCIDAISYEHDGSRHWQLDRRQRDYAIACAEASLTESDSYFAGRVKKTETILIAAQAAAIKPAGYLDSILETFQDWAAQKPLVPARNALNAKRLMLIRGLTEYFRLRYGTPLRRQVLIVVSCFFDTANMTESDIAKLAP